MPVIPYGVQHHRLNFRGSVTKAYFLLPGLQAHFPSFFAYGTENQSFNKVKVTSSTAKLASSLGQYI
jgi:hypothetical protein